LKLRNHPVLWAAIGVVVTIVLAAGVVWALQRTGDAKAVSDNAPLIAAVIALGGVFTAQMVSIALEQQRTREARDLEAQRAGEAALQNYFEQVGELLIEKPLRRASPGDNLSTVVRAQTLSVLEGLDPDRKRLLLLFLYESGLISERNPVVSLVSADLSGADLREADLSEEAALSKEAALSGTNVRLSGLSGLRLSGTNLRGTDLRGANLSGTDLSGAADLMANLSWANLSSADLRGANLDEASLRGADLSDAKLENVSLLAVSLKDAKGITNEQLEQHAKELGDATMPNGQYYEDWLKSKGRGEEGENSGPS
jgi:uncharacterized protein YjbI with pentapeptide repeats